MTNYNALTAQFMPMFSQVFLIFGQHNFQIFVVTSHISYWKSCQTCITLAENLCSFPYLPLYVNL